MSVKRDLRKVKLEDAGLRGRNPICIDPNLCPYYRMLWYKRKRIHDLGKINISFLMVKSKQTYRKTVNRWR